MLQMTSMAIDNQQLKNSTNKANRANGLYQQQRQLQNPNNTKNNTNTGTDTNTNTTKTNANTNTNTNMTTATIDSRVAASRLLQR